MEFGYVYTQDKYVAHYLECQHQITLGLNVLLKHEPCRNAYFWV